MSHLDPSEESNFGQTYEYSPPYEESLDSMFHEGFLCDVEISVLDVKKRAHRLILSSSSSYFRNLFKDNEPQPGTVCLELDLTDIFQTPENLEKVLNYLYRGDITLDKKNVLYMLAVNKVLCISSLNGQCAQFLLTRLRPINCLETWETALMYDLKKLANISSVLCRETICDVLLINDNIYKRSEDFISMLITNKDIMATVKPPTAVRMLLGWTYSQMIEHNEKLPKFISLADSYLNWRILSDIELESLRNLFHRCAGEFPDLRSSVSVSWLEKLYDKMKMAQLSSLQSAIDDVSGSQDPFASRQNWSLLVAEKNLESVGIYCNKESCWFTLSIREYPFKVLGIIENTLVFKRELNTLFLQDVDTMDTGMVLSPTYTSGDFERYTGTMHTKFFLYLNHIYCIDAVRLCGKTDLICVVSRWDDVENQWNTVLELTPGFSSASEIFSVSLDVETSYGDEVYLFITERKLYKNNPGPKFSVKRSVGESAISSDATPSFSGNFVGTSNKGSSVCMKPLEMFYVFCIDMKTPSYRLVATRQSEPANLNSNRKIILSDKIVFLLDPDSELESKFRYAFYYKSECFLNCLCLHLDSKDKWESLILRVPLPETKDISIKKGNRICLDTFVATSKNLLFIGTHWCPHVFQIVKYDLSNCSVSILPAIPLPAIRTMAIYPLHAHQPVSDLLEEESRTIDLLSFVFRDWCLVNWEGTLV